MEQIVPEIITAFNQCNLIADPIMTKDGKLLIISNQVILGHVSDQDEMHIWSSVEPDLDSIMNRQINGRPIRFTPEVKSWTDQR